MESIQKIFKLMLKDSLIMNNLKNNNNNFNKKLRKQNVLVQNHLIMRENVCLKTMILNILKNKELQFYQNCLIRLDQNWRRPFKRNSSRLFRITKKRENPNCLIFLFPIKENQKMWLKDWIFWLNRCLSMSDLNPSRRMKSISMRSYLKNRSRLGDRSIN